jgi:putative ABC transport system permease protein
VDKMLQIILGAVMLGLLWAVMTIGVYITYRILGIADLTVEGSIALGAAIAAQAIYSNINPYVATFFALIGGMMAGLATGLLHTKLKIPSLLSGILTMIALYSINLRILGKANLSLLRMNTVYTVFQEMRLSKNTMFVNLGISHIIPVITLGVVCVLGIIAILYWFFGTEIGCSVRATGDNPQMSRAQGINTSNMTILGLIISNGLVALSGALIAQQQCFADIQMGIGSIVIGLAFPNLLRRSSTVSFCFSWPFISNIIRPSYIIIKRLPCFIASRILWVTIKVVSLPSCIIISLSSSTLAAVLGSRAAVCSSNNKSFGLLSVAIKSVIA